MLARGDSVFFSSVMSGVAGAMIMSSSVSANDVADDAALSHNDSIIVVGQKNEEISVKPRGLAVSLGPEQFEAINAVNVEDLMKYAPNFFVRKRYIGDANGVPGFRGTHSTQSARTLVMVDGFLLSNFLGNSFNFPPKWGVVGPGEVAQYDIVYGPYSSRYIGNSIGGIVSISTKSPENGEGYLTAQGFMQPYTQYNTDDTYFGYSIEGGFGWKQKDGPIGLRASFRHFENEGQPMQFRQLSNSGAMAGTVVTGAVIDPNSIVPRPYFAADATDENIQDQFRLRADFNFGDWMVEALGVYWLSDSKETNPESYLRDGSGNVITSGAVNVDGTIYGVPALRFSINERQELLTGVRVEGPILGWDTRTNISKFWILEDKDRGATNYANGTNNGPGIFTDQNDPNWIALDFIAERAFGKHTVSIGATANRYETDTDIFSTTAWRDVSSPTLTNNTAGNSRLVGAFFEDNIDLADNFSVAGGARIDFWKAYDGVIGTLTGMGFVEQQYDARSDSSVNGAVSATWEISPVWAAQLSLATSTRFPTVGELYQGGLDSNGDFDPNSFDPDLQAEKSRDANLILRRDFGAVQMTGSVFFQRVEDAIFQQQGFNQFGVIVTNFQNIDVVRQFGVEGIVETKDFLIPGLNSEINVAFIDAETIRNDSNPVSEGVQFARIPKWRINGNLRYDFTESLRGSVGWRYNTRPNSDLEGLRRGDTFGYSSEQFIVDLRMSYAVSDNVEISGGIDNVNNDKAWAFHPFPQRTFLIEAKWRQ